MHEHVKLIEMADDLTALLDKLTLRAKRIYTSGPDIATETSASIQDVADALDEIIKIRNTKSISANTRSRVTYEMLTSASKFKAFAPTFKHYLADHVKSHIAEVPADEWETAAFLPTADFTFASKRKVWSDSRKSYK